MLDMILARLHQKHRTMKYPKASPPAPSDRFRGRPVLDRAKCPDNCRQCAGACPTGAFQFQANPQIDLGKCLFCGACASACTSSALQMSQEYALATRRREDLLTDGRTVVLAEALDAQMRRLFKRSLRLRQVSAGGCNACEADTNVLSTIAWDLSRFGIQFVASPRHADGILVTGPVTENMRVALRKTYDAIPAPKLVIAVGACAISGGPYAGSPQAHDGCTELVPVDLFVPGCPPHPLTILDGLLRLLGRI